MLGTALPATFETTQIRCIFVWLPFPMFKFHYLWFFPDQPIVVYLCCFDSVDDKCSLVSFIVLLFCLCDFDLAAQVQGALARNRCIHCKGYLDGGKQERKRLGCTHNTHTHYLLCSAWAVAMPTIDCPHFCWTANSRRLRANHIKHLTRIPMIHVSAAWDSSEACCKHPCSDVCGKADLVHIPRKRALAA